MHYYVSRYCFCPYPDSVPVKRRFLPAPNNKVEGEHSQVKCIDVESLMFASFSHTFIQLL